jgi:phospholipid transport system substrate-binding protein
MDGQVLSTRPVSRGTAADRPRRLAALHPGRWIHLAVAQEIMMLTAAFTRRSTLSLAVIAAGSIWLTSRAKANAASADAVAAVSTFNMVLLAAMKAGRQVAFNNRYAAMEPAIDQTFDLPTVLAVSVGLRWAALAPDQQRRLLIAFRRYTVASYVANFDSYAGQSFAVSHDTRAAGDGRSIVDSRIVPVSGDATKFGYVMSQTPSGWKVVDVLEDGSISRVAVQRSDFRAVLASGGSDALLEKLARKASDLSGGALA